MTPKNVTVVDTSEGGRRDVNDSLRARSVKRMKGGLLIFHYLLTIKSSSNARFVLAVTRLPLVEPVRYGFENLMRLSGEVKQQLSTANHRRDLCVKVLISSYDFSTHQAICT